MQTRKAAKRSKRYVAAAALVEKNKAYTTAEAAALIKKMGKDAESLELHACLGIDPKKGDQQVRGTISFPNSFGKPKRIIAFVESTQEKEAKEAGATIIGGEELVDEVARTGKLDFDIAVATPAMMPKLAKLAKILGPKGLMPNPKTDTVSANVKKMVEELQKGKIAFKNDDTGNVHLLVGKLNLSAEQLAQNLELAIEAVKKAKPSTSKGTYIKSMVIKATMSPGIKIAA